MKLISMHVDNFGGLHDYDYHFENGLNVVLHDNGWGKTTMAAFLKAMLYGYDTKRSKDITENERKRYLPWQGGKYGGYLDFEAEGIRYRIYRTFGETPRFDQAKIINLDTKVTARIPSDKIGETLFHLDANAFQRSVFINQNGLSIDGAASSIHTRLNTLVSQANDVAAFDSTITRLTQQVKVYEKTGSRGLIGDISRQIAEKEALRMQLDRDISVQDAARERIIQISLMLESIGNELKQKSEKLEAVSGESKKHEATQRLIDELSARIVAFQQQLLVLEEELGGGVPTRDEIDHVKQRQQHLSTLRSKLLMLENEHIRLTKEYDQLIARYNGAIPNASQLDEIQQLFGELQGLLTADESDNQDNNIPEEYALITDAIGEVTDFIPQLQTVIRSSGRIRDLHQQLETQDQAIQHESAVWNSNVKRFQELNAEAIDLQTKLKDQEAYSPSIVTPAVTALENMEKQQLILTQKEAETKAELQREEKRWAEKRSEYVEIKNQIATLQAALEEQRCYAEGRTHAAISQLEEHQRVQQRIDDLQKGLQAYSMSEEEQALLQEYPAKLPDANEGNKMLNRQRQVIHNRAEMQGLAARLEGEKSRRDSLNVSLSQLPAASKEAPVAVDMPKKSSEKMLVGSGAALIILGIILTVLVHPILGCASVLGALLVIVGLVNNRNNRKKTLAYETWKKETEQYEAAQRQQQLVLDQISEVQNNIQKLQSQYSALECEVSTASAAVSAWVAQWGNEAADSMEDEIIRIMECTARVAQLRLKQADCQTAQDTIHDLLQRISVERTNVENEYPTIAGLSADEACTALHTAHAKYQVDFDRLQTASQRLDKFIKDAAIPENEYGNEHAPCAERLQQCLQEIAQAREIQCTKRQELDLQFPAIVGCTVQEALSVLRSKLSAYLITEGQLEKAEQTLNRFVENSRFNSEVLQSEESPRMAELVAVRSSTEQELAQMIQQANIILEKLDLDTDAAHMPQAVSEASEMLNVYLQHNAKNLDHESRKEKKRQQTDALRHQIDEKLAYAGIQINGTNVTDALSAVRRDLNTVAQLQEKLSSCTNDLTSIRNECEQTDAAIQHFVSTHGGEGQQTDALLTAIYEKTDAYIELTAAKLQLKQQRASMEQTNHPGQAMNEDETALRAVIESLKERKEALLIEYTQKSEAIRQADRALERYPDIVSEIRSLYEQKQKAQSTLATLKRTIQLITLAKENLATRYLSRVEQLFNSYMRIWLNNDAIRGVLDIDFNVSIEENNKLHVAQGYSAGYCDMIDFCMRLALVDTLFEKEQPFLILDDPFVNLDTVRLEKALELLNAMAVNKQIVYFVCHPIRAVETTENVAIRTKFMQLAETAKSAISEQKKADKVRVTATRKSPKEAYKVIESEASHAIFPANTKYTITNSIFSMRFVPGESAAAHDYCFELFFIDAAGRVLNDRQMLEITDGQLSNERIQFNLNTRDDSGNEFELMIRESGHDDYEVAAKYPFRAKLAFTGTFNFDL